MTSRTKNIIAGPAALAALACLAAPGQADAQAVSVYLNSVRVNGLKNQNFTGCGVRFDAAGNVHITAAGFKIKAIPQAAPPSTKLPPVVRTPAPPRAQPVPRPPVPVARPVPRPVVKKVPRCPRGTKLFMVSQSTRPGHVQYDVDLYINNRWVRKVRNRDSQLVVELSRHLKSGRNKFHFAATKNYGGKPRLSNSAADQIRIIIGTGTRGGGTVTISDSLLEYKVGADRSSNFNKEMPLDY